jgi:hypothetical protein
MSSLLEEAIVDAKALKDAALKNAETAVLEKYSAEVRGALSTLLEQDELGLGLEEEEAPAADSSFTDDVPFAFQNEELDAPPDEELVEIDFNQLKTRIEEEEATGQEPAAPDLNDALGMADALQEDGPITDTELKDDSEEDAASLAGSDDREELQEDEDIALTEEMLSDLIEELVVDMVPRPQGWSSEGSAYNSIEQANDDAMLAALEEHPEGVEDEDEETRTAPDVVSDDELFENKYTELKESTRELRALLLEAKAQLIKLNLENAKLVYQNKALSSTSLNERQKDKIVEAVQLANSVEEANMIYETIQSAVGIPRSSNDRRPQTLREAVQRPTSLLLNSKKNNEATHDPNMDRMLRLAGLNK